MSSPLPAEVPRCLTIAGSDSGGGAGIQADLKAFARCGAHGMCAITALTAQSTVAVEMIEAVSPRMIVAQVDAVVSDIGVDAVKVGMLGDEPTIEAVVEALGLVGEVPIVVDPVMVAESGSELLAAGAKSALIERILPLATVITPNLPEARALYGGGDREGGGDRDGTSAGGDRLGRALLALGPGAVIITGGHAADCADVLTDRSGSSRIEGPRHQSAASHGSGCTHSSALAALLARGLGLADAARGARAIAAEAVRDGLRSIGAGTGPVDALAIARDNRIEA